MRTLRKSFRPAVVAFVLAALILPAAVLAAWPEDPAVDLFIGDGPGEQTVPHLVVAPDGSCYAGWYDNRSGNYDLAVQRLDAQGNEIWAHNGLLASDQPQNSWVMDWALALAGEDAVTAVTDIRTGDPTVSVNRITPAGDFPWGPAGIVVAATSAFIGPPELAVANDGDVIVVWEEHPDAGDDTIRMQRIAPDGTLRYADGGLVVQASATEMPGRPQVIAAGASDVIVAWVPNDGFMANRQVAAQKFDAAGAAVWVVPITIFSEGSLPFGHDYAMQSDGAGGVVFCWEGGSGLMIYSFVQHLDTDGQWLFPYGGLRLSTDDSHSEVYPQACYDQDSGCVLAFWRKTNGNQNMFGLLGQKFSPAGERLWGDAGRTFVAVSPAAIDFLNAAANPAGITLAWIANPSGVYAEDLITAMMVDVDGNVMWDPSPVDAATTLSDKGRLVARGVADGCTRLVWTDERSGTIDLAAKSLNVDGTLGGGSVSVEDPDQPAGDLPVAALTLAQNAPNPFNPSTVIAFDLPRHQHVRLDVYDVQGHLVRTLVDGVRDAGRHTATWRGDTADGRRAASGTYIYRLVTEDLVLSRTMVLAK